MTLSDGEIVEELETWRRFADALRDDDRRLFREMLDLCREYFPAMQARGPPFETEALFMALLLAQHKAIIRLTGEMERLKGGKDARLDT